MAFRFAKLTLRDLFWLILLSAIAIGWYLERTRTVKELAKYTPSPFGPNPTGPSVSSTARHELLAELGRLSEADLVARLGQIKAPTAYGSTDDYACCLTEMARRKLVKELQKHYDQLMTNQEEGFGGPANALALTALRRAQGKPDPLQIQIELTSKSHPESDESVEIPSIKPVLKNIDTEPIFITRGGDYRSGRQTRWRVHLMDEQGQRIDDSNFPQYGIGGGISSFGALAPGEASDNYHHLDARSYVHSPPTGTYQVQVIYSEQEIAAEPDLTGLIVWQSQPQTVQVTNRTARNSQPFARWPMIAIFFVVALVLRIVEVRRRARGDVKTPPALWLRSWRDAVGLVLLVVLTAGWMLDTRRLHSEIDRLRPDREAQWSFAVAASKH